MASMIPSGVASIPVPKPRTRFNCGKLSLPESNEENTEEEPSSSSTSIEIDTTITEQDEAAASNHIKVVTTSRTSPSRPPPPKPPRASPTEIGPTRPPPPAGWNLPLEPLQSPTSSNASLGALCSPPSRTAPLPPNPTRAEFQADKPMPVPPIPPRPLQLNNVVPLDSQEPNDTNKQEANSKEVSPNYIENPVYMSLQKYREMTVSSSNDSGFYSHQLSPPNNSTEKSNSETGEVREIPRSGDTDLRLEISLPKSLLDLKPLPPVPSSSVRKSFNDYTPPPKRDDFSGVPDSRVSIIDAHDEDNNPNICTDHSPEVEGVAVSFFGYVLIHIGKKEKKRVYARLKNMHLSFHDDDDSNEYLCGPFHLTGCQMISRSGDVISIRLNELESQKHLIFSLEDSKDPWSILLSECWLTQYELLRTSVTGMTTCGAFFLRQGTAAGWQSAAGGILGRSLNYVILDSMDCIYELDIRKIISVKEKVEKDQWCPLVKKKGHRGPFILVLEGCSLYIECEDDWSTNLWHDVINEILSRPATALDEYRLTGDNVPIIVDKCIRFISVYGMASEGIYRRNGKISEAKEILAKLNKDAPGVHLKPDTDETVYAVADVLRQFFRRLSAPLISHHVHTTLFNIVSSSSDIVTKCTEMGQCLQELSDVHHNTLRKLVIHLYNVSTRSAENRASVENLATVFAASLFHTESDLSPCFKDNSYQTAVIALLIAHYDKIYEITSREELSKVLIDEAEKVRTPQCRAVRADGLLVPIHKWEKENCPFNVKTELAAEEVCRQAMATRGFEANPDGKYAIYEKLRGSDLTRRLFDSERLSEVVINRWIPWKCNDGYFLFDRDNAADPSPVTLSSFSGKIKFAEQGTRSFKSMELKIDEGVKVVCYKGEKKYKEWPLDKTTWFKGAESSRKAPYLYNITFCPENSNFLEKYIGFCISFKSDTERDNFLNQIHYLQQASRPAPLVHI